MNDNNIINKDIVTIEFDQTEFDEDVRVDKFLALEFPDYSRSQLQNLVKKGEVTVNGVTPKNNYILKDEDEIVIHFPEPVESHIQKEDIPLNIVYEDSDVIVVNKPTGMVTHPAVGNKSGTLVNALMYHCNDLSGINGELRAGIVHRLDKDTSGLIVACKNDFAHKSLSEQFQNKQVNKIYYAICYGVIPHNVGVIDAPIGRNPQLRQQMQVVEGGKEAITHFKVLERFRDFTLVELKLETGRTHQIRVHMQYIGYPLLGDPVYGPKKVVGTHGQFLHAKKLGFFHPRTNEYMEFDSELPDYFQAMIDELGGHMLDNMEDPNLTKNNK